MSVKTADTAIEAAVQWWAEQLVGPTHWDNGDPSEAGLMTMMIGTLLAARHQPEEGQGEAFKAALISRLKGRDLSWLTLSVDYRPDRELGEAADEASIDRSRFPIKTHMAVHADHVTASLGYGARPRIVWSAPDWVRPICGEYRTEKSDVSEDYGYKYLPGICGKPRYHQGDGDDLCGDWQPCALCACGKPKDYPHYDRDNGRHEYTPTGPEFTP